MIGEIPETFRPIFFALSLLSRISDYERALTVTFSESTIQFVAIFRSTAMQDDFSTESLTPITNLKKNDDHASIRELGVHLSGFDGSMGLLDPLTISTSHIRNAPIDSSCNDQ